MITTEVSEIRFRRHILTFSLICFFIDKGVDYDKRWVMIDMITFYIAGYDPISHGQCSILYNVKKYDEVYQKLTQELHKMYKVQLHHSGRDIRNTLDSLDYLPLVIKETLRYDNPGYFSFGYQALEDITICNVPITKGSKIFLGIHGGHYNPKQWVEPKKFIPERFDVESEYFAPPNNYKSSKTRHPMAFVPFSFGLRNCPGKTLANLELKAMTAHFLSKFEYELEDTQKANDYLRFSLRTQFELKIKITKKLHHAF